MWNLRNKINKQTKRKQTRRHRDQEVTASRGAWGTGEKVQGYKSSPDGRAWPRAVEGGTGVSSVTL